jgi:hypothetical protein
MMLARDAGSKLRTPDGERRLSEYTTLLLRPNSRAKSLFPPGEYVSAVYMVVDYGPPYGPGGYPQGAYDSGLVQSGMALPIEPGHPH